MAIEGPAHRAERTLDTLKAPSLGFDLEGEVKRLWQEDASRAGRNAKTLVKHDDFRVVLTVLRAGRRIQEHAAAGRISIQTVQGHVRIRTRHVPTAELLDLPAGQLLVLDRGVRHDVEAVDDSAFLLTIAWPEGEPADMPGAAASAG
jgi:quercetin dioxygenase-like cupin family protein